MNRIGPALVAGAMAYAVIAIWQAAVNPSVIGESVAVALLLVLFCSLLAYRDTEKIKKGEIAAVWICIGLFVVYGLLKTGGFI